jgi:hypothetical protein
MVKLMGEAEYLEQQSEHAKAAMRATLDEMRSEAIRAVDPRRLTRAHPWTSLAVAAAAGFAASGLADRSPRPDSGQSQTTPRPDIARFLSIARQIVSFAMPIAQSLWAAHLATSEGRSNGENPSQTPMSGASAPPGPE